MVDITGNMTLFGLEVPGGLTQVILFLCIVALLFLFILEAEFRQLRRIAKRMDDEELALTKDLRELKESVRDFGEVLKRDFGFDIESEKSKGARGDIQRG